MDWMEKLLRRFGTPRGILSASRNDLEKVEGVGGELAGRIAGWKGTVDVERELELVKKYSATVISLEDETYPTQLREIYDPPLESLPIWKKVKGQLDRSFEFELVTSLT